MYLHFLKSNKFFLFLIGLTIGFIFSSIFSKSSPDLPTPQWFRQYRQDLVRQVDNVINENEQTVEDVKKIRIFCFLNSSPKNHNIKAIHIYNTWRKHCDKLVFASTLTDLNIGTMGFNVSDNHSNLWGKVKLMLQYIDKNFIDDYDWFFKGDDDTFMIPENLRFLLAAYSPDDPIHFGHKFNTTEHKNGYFSGGSGYVMSRRAARLFAETLLRNNSLCPVHNDDRVEDWDIAICFEKVGVLAVDARDLVKRERFLPFTPEGHLFGHPDPNFWYWQRKYYKTDEGLDCCSNYTVGYHYVDAPYMHTMYYLIYNVRTFGNVHRYPPPPKKLNFKDVAWLLEQQRVNSTYYNKRK